MKIVNQLVSPLPTAKASAPSTSSGKTDFGGTFETALASSSTPSKKTSQTQELKKKVQSEQAANSGSDSVPAPEAKIPTPIALPVTAATPVTDAASTVTDAEMVDQNLTLAAGVDGLPAVLQGCVTTVNSDSSAPQGTQQATQKISPVVEAERATGKALTESVHEAISPNASSINATLSKLNSSQGNTAEAPKKEESTSKVPAFDVQDTNPVGSQGTADGNNSLATAVSPLNNEKTANLVSSLEQAAVPQTMVAASPQQMPVGGNDLRAILPAAKDSSSGQAFNSTVDRIAKGTSNKKVTSSNPQGSIPSQQMGSSAKVKTATGLRNSDQYDGPSTDDVSDQDAHAVPALVVQADGSLPNVNSHASIAPDIAGTAAIQQVAQLDQAALSNVAQRSAATSGNDIGTPHVQASAIARDAVIQTAPSVSSAQLIQSMQHTEMRLGMQSAEFGNISINTSLNRQALSAQISIDHSELGRVLAVHMPAIEEKLSSAYGVQARVEVRDGGSNNASSFSHSGQQSKENRQSRSDTGASTSAAAIGRSSGYESSPIHSMVAGDLRLDIRI